MNDGIQRFYSISWRYPNYYIYLIMNLIIDIRRFKSVMEGMQYTNRCDINR